MTALAVEAPRFDMGRVVTRTFGTIGRNWQVFGLLALLLGAGPQLVLSGGQILGGWNTATPAFGNAGALFGYIGGMLGMVLFAVAAAFLLQAALVHGVVADLNGRRPTFQECLSTGMRFILPLLGLALLMGLALMLGFILLIVPGVILGLMWIVAAPVVVVERTGVTAAFSRSARLTKGFKGPIFGLLVVFAIVSWILSAAILAAGWALTGGITAANVTSWPVAVLTALIGAIQSLVGSTGIASIYYELRSIKEGAGPESLASVFD